MPSTTGWIILATIALWLIYDIYLFTNDKETLSAYIRRWSNHMMAIVFIVGFLMGHWFWPLCTEKECDLVRIKFLERDYSYQR